MWYHYRGDIRIKRVLTNEEITEMLEEFKTSHEVGFMNGMTYAIGKAE